jgi:hypothetical protein
MLKRLKARYTDFAFIKNALIHIAVTGGAVALFGAAGLLVPVVLESYQALKNQKLDLFDAGFDLCEHLLGGLAALILL